MKLYLVQHGKSKSKEEDPDRPLTEGGRIEVQRVAQYVTAWKKIAVPKIFHSGKTRARQTAEILAEYLWPQGGVEAVNDLAPMDDPALWADKMADSTENIMLVGHLPYLSKLCSLLVCGDSDNEVVDFVNGGVVCLSGDDEGGWSVSWVVIPSQVP